MKIISVFVGLLALLLVDVAMAAGAVATSVTGAVSVQSGTAAARPLRQGDSVTQGDLIVTGAASSAVLRFDDGEITALTSNSRLQVTAYQYNPSNNSGNVFLSLISGGMKAITGLIGRGSPNNVAYRAATATIGIRGTEVDIVTDGDTVVVSVDSGKISFTYNGNTVTLDAGQGAFGKDGKITTAAASQLFSNPAIANLAPVLGSVAALTAAINMSTGTEGSRNETFSTPSSATSPTAPGTGSGGGGTTVSSH
ncbi:MAG TPA: FecR family protein [Usitatibacter sp.]|nr:FecR family protein [Usitatibacter sp.]